jgi:hypothetical protein
MEVTCNNKGGSLLILGCPWKSTLNNLLNHLKYCCYEANKLPEYIKKRVDSTNKIETNEDGEVASDKYLDFNPSASLAARLYNKNPVQMTNAMKEGNDDEEKDLIDMLTNSDKKTSSTLETSVVENINNIDMTNLGLKRSN